LAVRPEPPRGARPAARSPHALRLPPPRTPHEHAALTPTRPATRGPALRATPQFPDRLSASAARGPPLRNCSARFLPAGLHGLAAVSEPRCESSTRQPRRQSRGWFQEFLAELARGRPKCSKGSRRRRPDIGRTIRSARPHSAPEVREPGRLHAHTLTNWAARRITACPSTGARESSRATSPADDEEAFLTCGRQGCPPASFRSSGRGLHSRLGTRLTLGHT